MRENLDCPNATDRGRNPFSSIPVPIPVDGWGLRALDIFRERPLASHLNRNAGWLQAFPRTSDEIEAALFPEYSLGGMQHKEVRSLLNRGIWDLGYAPSNDYSDNPTWTMPKGD